MLNSRTTETFHPEHTLGKACNKKRMKSLAGPYRRVRVFMNPDRDNREYDPRGMVFVDAQENLFYVDASVRFNEDPSKPSEYHIHELGIREMKGLPSKGKGNAVNPDEQKEVKALLGDEASEEVQNDLRALLKLPPKQALLRQPIARLAQ